MAAKNHKAILTAELQKCEQELQSMIRPSTTVQSSAWCANEGAAGRADTAQTDFWKKATDMLESKIQSPQDIERMILAHLGGNGPIETRERERVRKICQELMDLVLQQSENTITEVQDHPLIEGRNKERDEEVLHIHGLKWLIVKHHAIARGLRAHLEADMATFVEMFNKTDKPLTETLQASDYHNFFHYYSKVSTAEHKDHSQCIKLHLEEFGAGIKRRMLVLGTHIVQLIVCLDTVKQLSRHASECESSARWG